MPVTSPNVRRLTLELHFAALTSQHKVAPTTKTTGSAAGSWFPVTLTLMPVNAHAELKAYHCRR
jgi:hypothetical protein